MPPPSPPPVKLLAELLELDKQLRGRRNPPTLQQRQRRTAISRQLHDWAMAKQEQPGRVPQRSEPRAALQVAVELLGGPHRVLLMTESVAIGGLSCEVSFSPKRGDLLHLRILPDGEAPFEVMAEVVWWNANNRRAGMAFRQVPEEGRAVLERMVFRGLIDQQKP